MIQFQQMTSQSKHQTSQFMTQVQIQSMSHASLSTNQDSQIKEVMNVTIESHTQFLRTLKEMKKHSK
jgi:hypothetical protein